MNNKQLLILSFISLVAFIHCDKSKMQENSPSSGFLTSNLVNGDSLKLLNFSIPTSYDTEGSLAPGTYYGQKRRLAQLQEIKDSSRNEPIKWDIRAALANENQNMFKSDEAQGSENIRTKIDELNFDNGNTSVADDIASLSDSLVQSSQANYRSIAANGTAGMITTGDKKRHVSANGLEYAEILEKSLYGALLYDQMVDDYLSDSQSGVDNEEGNNILSAEDYELYGTERQHKFDEAFGYFGAEAATYPNQSNSSNGDGIFLANYIFDFSDETEAMYGVNLAKATMNAFVVGRSVLKAGQGNDFAQENINEELFNAARADIKLYVEAGMAASAIHYLNEAITDVSEAEKLHHLSEAMGFIYAMSFNSDGRLSPEESHTALMALDWSATDRSLNGIYGISLWEITDEQMNMAIDIIDESFPGFKNAGF
tara:strand:+ start:170 stop:1450 length:1281 start_codon:yes stop_codon:yes gene_type:complete